MVRSLLLPIGLLFAALSGVSFAQQALLTDDAPPAAFVGERFCFVTEWSHQGEPGFGPVLRLVLPPELAFNSARIFGTGQTQLVGTFPIDLDSDADTTLTDPLTGLAISGPQGHSVRNVILPFGSVVEDEPLLPVELCLTIDPQADLGVALPISMTPIYQFGDTASADNGPIVGAARIVEVAPSVVVFEKTNTAPERERPPGPSWPFSYRLTADIANTAVLNPMTFTDVLPSDFVFQSATVSGGEGCELTEQPDDNEAGGRIVVVCSGDTIGSEQERDVEVRVTGYWRDLLDDQVCTAQAITNAASLESQFIAANGAAVVLPSLTDPSTVTARHLAIQKSASPWVVRPGQTIGYRQRLQISDFVTINELVVVDVLDDGIDFLPTTVTVRVDGGEPIAIALSDDDVVIDGATGRTEVTLDVLAALSTQTLLGGTAVELRYQGRVREAYRTSGEAVLASDRLGNAVTANYALVNGASACTQGSRANVRVEPVALSKSVVNAKAIYEPGDTLIYRLRMDIPSGDSRDIEFVDYLPLPVLKVADVTPLFSSDPDDCPNTAGLCPGPNDTLGLTPTAISVDTASNALTIDWPDVLDAPQAGVIEVDLYTTVTDDPFADGLFLTNLLQLLSRNTPGEVQVETATAEVQVGAPRLVLSKGVVGSDGDGSLSVPLGTFPENANLSGAQAGDQVDFQITIENLGRAPAFEVAVVDDPPTGLKDCGQVQVSHLGSGQAVAFTGDLFDANAPLLVSSLAPRAADDRHVLLIDYRCEVDLSVQPEQLLTNVSAVTYRSQPDGPSFPTEDDQAIVEIASVGLSKSLVASSEAHSSDSLNPPRLTIGEIARYRLVIDVPRATLTDFEVRDLLPSGLQFLDDGTTTVALVSASGADLTSSTLSGAGLAVASSTSAVSPSFVLPDANISPSSFGSSTDPRFALGTLINQAQSDAWVVIEFNALVLNQSNNQQGRNRPNRFEVSVDGETLGATSNVVTFRLAEPVIEINKSAAPQFGDAGDEVTFTIELAVRSGINNLDAFEVTLRDRVPALIALDAQSLSAESSTDCGSLTLSPTMNVGTGEIDAAFDRLVQGCSLTLTYRGELTQAVAPGSVVENLAEVSWTSLPGAGTVNNPTGSVVPGKSGDADGERIYTASDRASINITGFDLIKRVVNSDNPFTTNTQWRPGVTDAAIGETVTFQIATTVPEGTTPSVILRDSLPFTQGLMAVVDAQLVSVGADLQRAGAEIEHNPPIITVLDAQLDDGIEDTVVFDFGRVINPANGAGGAAAQLLVEVNAVLLDRRENISGKALRNAALLKFGDGLSASATADVDVVEPLMSLNKTGSVGQGDAGDLITFTLTMAHRSTSTADAHNVFITDDLPAALNLLADSAQLLEGPDGCEIKQLEGRVELECERIALGERAKFEFQATLDVSVEPGQVVRNIAEATWSSMPGTVAGQRLYQRSDRHDIRITAPGLIKTIFSTSNADTDAEQFGDEVDLTIGERVTYELILTLPEGSSEGVVVRDQLPTGSSAMEVLSGEIKFIGNRISGGAALSLNNPGVLSDSTGDGVNDRITWALGDLVNAPDNLLNAQDTIVFHIDAVVLDDPINQSGVVKQTNTAQVTTLTSAPISASAAIDLVAPQLALDKTVLSPADGLVDAGDVVEFALTLRHDGSTAPAYELVIADLLPQSGLDWDASFDVTQASTCPGLSVDDNDPKAVVFTLPRLDLELDACTITYRTVVAADVTPNQRLLNTAQLRYDSMPALVAGQTRRRTDRASAEIVARPPDLIKRVIDSSLSETGSGQHSSLIDLAIGERVTYELILLVPEGQTPEAVLIDEMPITEDGTTLIEVMGGKVLELGANISTSKPGQAQLTDRSGDGVIDTIAFDFGTIRNAADNRDRNDRIVVQVVGRVRDAAANVDAQQLVNVSELTFATAIEPLLSEATVELVEPDLSLTKTMGPVAQGVVSVRLQVRNEGTAPAYDVMVTDVLDDALWRVSEFEVETVTEGFILELVAGPEVGQHTVRWRSDPTALERNFIAVDGTIQAEFKVPLEGGPARSTMIQNTAQLSACSVPAGCGEAGGGRIIDEIEAEAELTLPDLELLKTAQLRIDADRSGDVSPGDTVRYTLTLRNRGQAAAHDVVITDAPDPLTRLLSGSVVASKGVVAAGNAAGDSSLQVNIDHLDVDEVVSVRFDVQLDSAFPANIDSIANQAVVTSTELPPTLSEDPGGSEPDGQTVIPVNAVPTLLVTKALEEGVVAPGATLVYGLNYTNTGQQTATGVRLTETVPAFTRFSPTDSDSGWQCVPNQASGSQCTLALGSVEVGESGQAAFAVVVDADLPLGVDSVANTVRIGDDGNNSTVPSTDRDQVTTAVVFSPALALSKTAIGSDPSPAVWGSVLSYELLLSNIGNQALTGVEVTDPLVGPFDAATACTWPDAVGTLLVGETASCVVHYTVTIADSEQGEVVNIATANSDQTAPVSDQTTVEITPLPAIDLNKTITAGSPYLNAGDVVAYELTATNVGGVTLFDVVIDDPLATVSGCQPAQPAPLAPGEQMVCQASYAVSQADVDNREFVNVASASGTDRTGTVVTDLGKALAVDPNAAPAVTLDKVIRAGAQYASVGEVIEYQLTATNVGNVTLLNVVISDDAANLGACEPVQPARLAPGEALVCAATHGVTQADIDQGSFINTAVVNAEGPQGRAVAAEAEATAIGPAAAPAIELNKIITEGSPYERVGDLIRYRLTATNRGNVTLSSVEIDDPLANLGVCTPAKPARLAPGEALVCAASYAVTQVDIDAREFINTASVLGVDPNGTQVGDEDSATAIDPTAMAAIVLDKTADTAGPVSLDAVIEYTLTAVNSGDVTLNAVYISDDMIELTCQPSMPAVLAPQAQLVCRGHYQVVAEDLGAAIVNHARVVGRDADGVVVEAEATLSIQVIEPIPVPANQRLALILLALMVLLVVGRLRSSVSTSA